MLVSFELFDTDCVMDLVALSVSPEWCWLGPSKACTYDQYVEYPKATTIGTDCLTISTEGARFSLLHS